MMMIPFQRILLKHQQKPEFFQGQWPHLTSPSPVFSIRFETTFSNHTPPKNPPIPKKMGQICSSYEAKQPLTPWKEYIKVFHPPHQGAPPLFPPSIRIKAKTSGATSNGTFSKISVLVIRHTFKNMHDVSMNTDIHEVTDILYILIIYQKNKYIQLLHFPP